MFDRNAFGQRVAAKRHLAMLDCAFHRGIELGLDPDQFDVRLHRARCDRHARHQAAAADRHDDRIQVRRILEHLEPDRAGTGDDLRIVEGVDEDVAIFERQLAGAGKGVVDDLAVKHDLGAVAFGLRHLHDRSRLGHDDHGGDAEAPGVIGDGLRMIARRRSNYATGPLFGRELEQFVERAAFLVGGGELEVLELQPDLGPNGLRQRPAYQHRGADDGAVDPLRGRADVVDRRGRKHGQAA